DRTSAIYQYLSAPIVGVFGLSRFTTRFIAALAGTLLVGLLGGFMWRRLGAASGLVTMALAAFHPTGILFSRWAQQGIIVLPLTVGGVWLLWEALEPARRHRRGFVWGGTFLLGLAAYTYDPARLVIPLIVTAFVAVHRKAL